MATDCEIIYINILLINEHNGDVSPENRVHILRVPTGSVWVCYT